MKNKPLKLSEHQEIESFVNYVGQKVSRVEELLNKRFGEGSFPSKFAQEVQKYNGYLQEKLVHTCQEDEKSQKKKPSKDDAKAWGDLYGQMKEQYREDSGN